MFFKYFFSWCFKCFLATPMMLSSYVNAQPAAAFLERSKQAYGEWNTVKTFHYKTERTSTNPWQSFSFVNPSPAASTIEFFVDWNIGAYQTHTVFNYPGGYVFDLVTIGKDSTRYLYDHNKSRNGMAVVKQGKESYTANLNAGLQNLPYYITKSLAETQDSLTYSQEQDVVRISRFFKNGSQGDYFYDAKSKLLQKTRRTQGGKIVESFYTGYKSYGGLLVATAITQKTDGAITGTEAFTVFKPAATINASSFELPAGYNIPPAPAPKPWAAEEIAKDVFLISAVGGDRNIVFINMNDYIVVTEAPLSSDITKAVLDVIHTQIPGKPIKYVHLSHHHNDHTGGIRQMVAEGAHIICTPPVQGPMQAILDGALGSAPDDFSKKPSKPVFELISNVKVLEDSDHRIEFHAVNNSHADGLSFLFLPGKGIIYQGDLLSLPEDGTITPAIKVTREFAAYLSDRNIKYHRIIGHHGHAAITPGIFNAVITAQKN